MIGFYDYTVIATYGALFIALHGIYSSAAGNPAAGLLCLICCGVIDTFDGRIARSKKDRTADGRRFGIQIDSLNDLVCFGVLPASIGAAFGMKSIVSHALLSLYVLRRSYAWATSTSPRKSGRRESTEDRTHYLGLPVTAVCIVMPAVYLISSYTNAGAVSLFNIMFPIMALAFISPLKIKKLRLPGIIAAGALIIAEAGMIASALQAKNSRVAKATLFFIPSSRFPA